jgi:Holliday junction resolvase
VRRRASRTDANQSEIVKALRKAGVSVAPTHAVGDGFGDLVCGYRGRSYLVEVKDRLGELTEDQAKFVLSWRGDYHVVRSVRDALAVFGLSV